ncbi:hypothetical protein FEM03_03105 [Phragmitibacter flavus]|uniref:Uncharacterized protein n=1 Tax=Phragmitibacter flavus TaxID=2576071 RepID=A0A5R8KL21_9BACT|nr:hypothetical protein [Phragmitibacter flavus]TLD72359.1 hypothetical protein FEM03_03105 [Phragmitibacter flavus]
MNRFAFLIAGWVLAAGMVVGQQQLERDPLTGLVGEEEEPVGKGEWRLNTTLLRMSRADAGRLLLEDVGGASWEEKLVKLKDGGKLERVSSWTDEVRSLKGEWGGMGRVEHRYLSLIHVARYWDNFIESEVGKSKRPDMAELLNMMGEGDRATWGEVGFEIDEVTQLVDLNIHLHINRGLLERECKSWPLPNMSVFKAIFRPWELKAWGKVALNRVFLMGAQMDVDGRDLIAPQPTNEQLKELAERKVFEVENEMVLFAFGKVVGAEADQAPVPEVRSDSGLRMQCWTLAVEPQSFSKWMANRKGTGGDEGALKRWLEGKQAELLACSAVTLGLNEECRVDSKVTWEDVGGFEPSGNSREFRVVPCETMQFSMKHHLRAVVRQTPDIKGEARSRRWKVYVEAGRPAAPAVWKWWKSSMERGDDDPWGVEVPEADADPYQENGSEAFKTDLDLDLGEVVMASAGLKDGRVHATFVRLVNDGPIKTEDEKVRLALEDPRRSRGLTTWIIETPLDWGDKLLRVRSLDAVAFGNELLAAVDDGSAEVVGLLSNERLDEEGNLMLAKPLVFFGGYGVLAHPHAKGILFRSRSVGLESVGDQATRFRRVYDPTGGGEWLETVMVRSTRLRGWNQWGVWLSQLKNFHAGNSGFKQPELASHEMALSAALCPGVAKLIAVTQTSKAAMKEGMVGKLRWYVSKLDVHKKWETAVVTPVGKHPIKERGMVQAMVLKGDSESLDAARWLEMLGAGVCEVIDSATFAGGDGTLKTGMDYYFLNGRDYQQTGSQDEELVFSAPEKMPEQTKLATVMGLWHRLVGLEITISGEDWSIFRDEEAPKVVTDVFPNVKVDWPFAGDERYEKSPKLTVNVQRPIFNIQRVNGKLPAMGDAVIQRLSTDTVLLLRRIPLTR